MRAAVAMPVLAAAACGAVLLAALPAARGASLVPPQAGPAGTRAMVLPEIAGGVRMPQAGVEPPGVPPSSATPAAAAGELVLRTLSGPSANPEVAGETGTLAWTMTLTADQAAAARMMQIAYRTAVSVLPERSSLALVVNGRSVGSLRPFSPSGWALSRFDLPTGLLRPGRNDVRVSVSQRHRVDCSVPATFELWTRLDMARTGLLLPAGTRGPADIADLAAVPAAPDGSMPLRLAMPGRLKPAAVGSLMGVVEATALALPNATILTDFGPPAGGPAGLNLALGSAEELTALGIPVGEASRGSALLVPATPERRATLAVVAEDPADVVPTLQRLAGLSDGVTDPAGPLLQGGERMTLAELGHGDVSFGGRVYRTRFRLRMPADLLPADYASLRLELDGAYAAGLSPGAAIRVEVNGRSVASAPLDRAQGQTLRSWPIHLPVGVFRPGDNEITLVAALPDPSDEACTTTTASAERPRLLLLASSTLVVPRLARVRRTPDLSQTVAGGLPSSAKAPAWLHVPAPDRDTMGAAGTLLASLARAAGRTIPIRFTTAPPPQDGADRLTLVAGDALADFAVRLGRVTWRDPTDVPRAAKVGQPASKGASPMPAGAGESPEWAVAWPQVQSTRSKSLLDLTEERAGAVVAALTERFDTANAAWFSRTDIAPGQATLVFAQDSGGERTDGAEATSTLVAALSPAALRMGLEDLVTSGTWSKLDGSRTVIDGRDVVAMRTTQSFSFPPGTRSPGNVRLVVAGWLSLNPGLFSSGILLLALVVALTTRALLARVGRTSAS